MFLIFQTDNFNLYIELTLYYFSKNKISEGLQPSAKVSAFSSQLKIRFPEGTLSPQYSTKITRNESITSSPQASIKFQQYMLIQHN